MLGRVPELSEHIKENSRHHHREESENGGCKNAHIYFLFEGISPMRVAETRAAIYPLLRYTGFCPELE